MTEAERIFALRQKECRRAATQLYYPKSVIKQIMNAKTESELERIMITARKSM